MAQPSTANRRILLIDDMPSIHEDFRRILAGDGAEGDSEMAAAEQALFGEVADSAALSFELDSAYQGCEGLELVRSSLLAANPYAMAFVDMRMPPGWDGVETIREIWKADPRLQVVICTAHSDYSWAQVLGELGAEDRLLILKKPFDNVEVAQLASALTTKWDMTRQAGLNVTRLEEAVKARTQALEIANTELLRAQKLEAVGQLAAGVAHEINTPIQFIGDNLRFIADSLAPINGLLDGYREALCAATGPDGPEGLGARREALAVLEKDIDLDFLREEMVLAARQAIDGTERVATIVHAMKAVAHPGGARKDFADLNEAIRDALVVANSEIKLVADVVLDLAELPPVWCNVGDIHQAVLNLIINSAYAMGDAAQDGSERGTLTVRTRTVPGAVVVEIADTGNGIPAEIADRVFEQFFTTKGVGVGTGQGLALVYSLIHDRHEGTVNFTSTLGAGTTFTIQLPQAVMS